VNCGEIPDDLNAEETERFLREYGAKICGFRLRLIPSELFLLLHHDSDHVEIPMQTIILGVYGDGNR
jgi:hypothetical protein